MMEPLQAVAGNIPGLKQISTLMAMASSQSSSSGMTEAEIKKIIGDVLPPMPDGLMGKAQGLVQDVRDLIPTIPLVLINMIFAMLNVIYSKLQIITSIVPLGSLFPLNLIPTAITAVPVLMNLMLNGGSYVQAMVEGLIRKKIAEAAALKIPSTKLDPDLLASLVADIWEDETTKRASTKKKLTYKKVLDNFYLSDGHAMGYTQSQLKDVMKNYLRIHDGSNTKLTKYEDNYKPQNLANLGAMAWLGFSDNPQAQVDKSNESLGYEETKQSITRSEPSPKDFETYLVNTPRAIPNT